MPELPEVEHVKRGIAPRILGATIKNIAFSNKVKQGKESGKETIIKGTTLDEFIARTKGYKIEHVYRRSKYIFIEIENEQAHHILMCHFGMTGAFFTVPDLSDIAIENHKKHWHVIFELDNGLKLIYTDIRRFGELRALRDLNEYPSVLKIAPEPFVEEAFQHYSEKINERKFINKPIKTAILDHSVISGCGNIYACEALIRAGILPMRTVKELSKDERRHVFNEVVNVLQEGIDNGGSSISDYYNADGEKGSMQDKHMVYGKKVCVKCGNPVEQQVIATRNTYYCPNCQK
ncbi:bifunctional DNA-formamidopyrimidine glycosylase/DNA-(apurinic or apyrimidinic site) lyase [Mammaliicoccus stepanovicii]|uniref:Formamidopyrimidine-DNA glycosylase n=1 Tax=Mammaliicoccus stepanovicii TaxID=643214 RepID=A0A239Z1Y4_9STAP|nr:bifunctional DNA-formamidopyrimidine glycosylase/DNA-(apurinic or apyrimidinic site) lyase [Mammaliicoccus stepanovicii]PNZ78088.1 bifunctional DNA-formamidopyrimidine glycosylase/DNA-(apurinic or apyrimidinic site) lyase [Mammaliicoccus stepanovicii]GGI40317.1 formamidopyrimidine-DNA glycosylase [Mammaliicoccus stepanovicii]SNV64873.1 formamidopyrimidine-DNA glycosylase [Mammaliicoccus stepanovicii]